jgi:hypothetical protein
MGYLNTYGKRARRFQQGGAMAPEAMDAAPQPAAPEEGAGSGQEEQILELAQAAVAGDQQAAAELGMLLAPMILQQVEAGMAEGGPEGGAPAEPAAPEPVFRKGGVFVGSVR